MMTYPENFPPLAELLDQIIPASAWSGEFDSQLGGAKARRTYDDGLENVAIELIESYRDMLRGVPPRKRRVKPKLSIDELRGELRAVAGDIRLAVKTMS